MYQLLNTVEDKVIGEFETADALIDFVRIIAIENEDYNFSILGLSDAKEYLEDFCGNLKLI